MTQKNIIATVTIGASAAGTGARGQSSNILDFIQKIKSSDDKVRGEAWQNAGPLGASAVKPLSEVMTDANFEVARSAKRALWKIVRHAGRPGTDKERKAVSAELTKLLKDAPTPVKREVLWMLSEIGDDNAIPAMAELLKDKELREDARCSIQRIPGKKATDALNKAFASAPEDFKYALADSLRARGLPIKGYPTRKLIPTKETTVGRVKNV